MGVVVVRQRALHLVRSNRVESLADAAAELFAAPAANAGPLDAEHIVVQGRGMAVWLSMQMSRRHGIWAGAKFLYPRNFVQHLFLSLVGTGISKSYDRHELMWSLLALLSERIERPELAVLARYLVNDDSGVRRYQLAQRVADVFDQYVTYRPDRVRGSPPVIRTLV